MNKAANPESGPIRRFARKIADVIADCVREQRTIAELMTAPDRYLTNPDVAPDTYSEFLFRTSGVLHHEQPARARTGR